MKDFEELTEDKQNEVIMNIGTKLTGQEIWYWECIVHKLREYDKYFDSDEEIKKGLVDRIKRQEKEIQRLTNIIKEVRELLNQEWYSVLRKETITKVKEILDKVEV